MPDYAFRIVNVFAETSLGGNPLAVFEDARGLDEATMQALALQFNLSETTFVLPSERATARVRIFTRTSEMPFVSALPRAALYQRPRVAPAARIGRERSLLHAPRRSASDRFHLGIVQQRGDLERDARTQARHGLE